MIQISQNTQNIQPSKIRKMFNKAPGVMNMYSASLWESRTLPPRRTW